MDWPSFFLKVESKLHSTLVGKITLWWCIYKLPELLKLMARYSLILCLIWSLDHWLGGHFLHA
jgi:hypothetical protein